MSAGLSRIRARLHNSERVAASKEARDDLAPTFPHSAASVRVRVRALNFARRL